MSDKMILIDRETLQEIISGLKDYEGILKYEYSRYISAEKVNKLIDRLESKLRIEGIKNKNE